MRTKWGQLTVAGWLCGCLIGWPVWGADITPGYSFTSGERNVTHTKLNLAAAGDINTSFFSGKSSAGSSPNSAFEILLRDTSLDVFKKTTIAAGFLDHTGLLSARTAKTVPIGADQIMIADSAAGDAYKRQTLSNAMYNGAATGVPTNGTRIPVLIGGELGSLTLSNLFALLTTYANPTNADKLMLLNSAGGIAGMTLQALVTGASRGSNWSGNDVTLTWDGTRLRSTTATNQIDGLTVTNTVPTTNDALSVLQAGVLKKLFLNELRTWINASAVAMTQSVYTVTTNIAGSSGNWSNVTALGTSALAASILPRSNSVTSKILVRVVLNASAAGGSDPAMFRVVRGGDAIGVGTSDAASRTEAGGYIPNSATPNCVAWEFLDTTGSTNTTYQVQVKTLTGNTTYINRSSADTDNENHPRLVSSITLTEILQ